MLSQRRSDEKTGVRAKVYMRNSSSVHTVVSASRLIITGRECIRIHPVRHCFWREPWHILSIRRLGVIDSICVRVFMLACVCVCSCVPHEGWCGCEYKIDFHTLTVNETFLIKWVGCLLLVRVLLWSIVTLTRDRWTCPEKLGKRMSARWIAESHVYHWEHWIRRWQILQTRWWSPVWKRHLRKQTKRQRWWWWQDFPLTVRWWVH